MDFAAGFNRQDGRLGVNFAKMMLRDRYLGTGLGGVWAILQPASLIAVFVFVFTFIFKSRLSGQEESDLAFVIWLVSGYGPWLALNEGIMGGATSVVSQTGIIKNMAFKTELLPISATTVGLAPLLVSVVVLTTLITIDGRAPDTTWLIMPVVLLLQTVFVAGIGLYLGAINVFVRDVTLALPSILTMLLFLSPIFYPLSIYPENIQAIVQWNPFYVIANGYRSPIVYGEWPPLWQLAYLTALAVTVFWTGLRFFRKRKPYFHSRL